MSRSLGLRVGRMILGASLLVGCPLAANHADAAESYPRILHVRGDRPAQRSVDLVVPPLLAGAALPATAFEVSVNGRRSRVTAADRLAVADLRIMFVIGTTVPPAVLDAQVGAARELVFQLPATAQAGVIAGGPDPELVSAPDTDRSATVRALAALRPQPADDAVDVTPSLDLALTALATGHGTNVVVAVDPRPTSAALPYDVSRADLGRRTAVYSIVLGRPPAGYLAGLPELSGGRVLTVTRPELLLNAFDTVRAELQGRYRVGYSATGDERTVKVVVTARGVTATTTFAASGAVTSAALPPDRRGPDRPVGLLVGVLVVIAISAVLVGRLSTPLPT